MPGCTSSNVLPIASSKATKSLPVLHAGGFSASVDAYACEPDPNSTARQARLWFLSLLGPKESVRALWAQMVKGETATLSFGDLGSALFCSLAPEGLRGWRFYTANLRAVAGYHGLLVPEAALYAGERSDFLLLVRKPAEAPALHHRFLNRRLDLPLHPDWARWLWERALSTGEAIALESLRLHAYRCVPNRDALAADLTLAIRRGALGPADWSASLPSCAIATR